MHVSFNYACIFQFLYFKMAEINGPFRRCHVKLRFLALFLETKIHRHKSIYRTEFSLPVKFQEKPLQTLGNLRSRIFNIYKEVYPMGQAVAPSFFVNIGKFGLSYFRKFVSCFVENTITQSMPKLTFQPGLKCDYMSFSEFQPGKGGILHASHGTLYCLRMNDFRSKL